MLFKIYYGLKDLPLKEETLEYMHLGEAMQDAHDKAIQEFLDTEQGQELKKVVYKKSSDRYTALGTLVHECHEFIDYFAEEFSDKKQIKVQESEMFLVSQQINAFDNEFNQITIEKALELLHPLTEVSLDTETTGLDVHTDRLLLLQLGNDSLQIIFDISTYGGILPKSVKDYLNEPGRQFILQNAKFDLKFLFKQEVLLRSVYDTMLAETILTNGLQYAGRGLKDLVYKYCGVQLNKEIREEFTTIGITKRGIQYAADDIKYLPAIKKLQLEYAKEVDVMRAINLDNLFVTVLAYTEYCGIRLDYDKWMIKYNKNVENVLSLRGILAEQLHTDGKLGDRSGSIDLFSGERTANINWNSSTQVKKVFKDYGINLTVTEKGVKKESVNEDVLKSQVNDFPILKPYIEYKKAYKDLSTYGTNWKQQINPVTGRIHTTFKQILNTGRMSSGNAREGTVNLQNLPGDEETRSCFIPDKGNTMISADYSSQEQILLANFSREKNLLNFYARGFTDMHSYIAFLMYPEIRKCSLEELTPDKLTYLKKEYPKERGIAKAAGFAINYGGNGSTIAKNCGLTPKEGDFVYNSYFESFPQLKDFFEWGFRKAIKMGYIEFNNVTKRKYFFDKDTNHFFMYHDTVTDPGFWQTHEDPRSITRLYNAAKSEIQKTSQNYPIQGSASDLTKYAGVMFMREILKREWWLKVKIVNFIHDEILIECPTEIAKEVEQVLLDCMKDAAKPFCKILPLGADASAGECWIH